VFMSKYYYAFSRVFSLLSVKKQPKIAIVCDWLTNLGGAERVVEQIHKTYLEAPIYTSVYNAEALPMFRHADVRTSWLQKLPFLNKRHQVLLPLMPMAFESFDLSEYDVVISSSFACAKGVITNPETVHICYCHNPTRYFWDESHEFLDRYQFPGLVKFLARPFLHKLRMWDRVAAERPDYYLANSSFVAKRIKKYYNREAKVLYPGIELPEMLNFERKDFYLMVGRITAHKYFDLVIKAFNKLKLPLKVVGTGSQLEQLQKLNTSDKTQFLGFVSENELQRLYASARAIIFPQCEDFGIVPIEAQAQGCPVIAYAAGGALETVGSKGILFDEQSVEAISDALDRFNNVDFDQAKIRKQAEYFEADNFRDELRKFVDSKL